MSKLQSFIFFLLVIGHMFMLIGLNGDRLSQAQTTLPSIIINELAWAGSSASSSDEWIELRNLTDQPVDLTGWKLTKKSSGAEVPMLTIPSGTIAPHGYWLIANFSETHVSSSLMISPDLVETDVSLVNSALQIKLYDATDVLIDIADDGSGSPLAGKVDSAHGIFLSMERNRLPGDGSLAQSWHTANGATNLDPGIPDLATPRTENSNALPTAVAGTDQSGVVGETLSFDGSDSTDPDEDVLALTWDFGDGVTATGLTPNHVYTAAGGYTVTLTVSDGVNKATDTLMAEISSPPAASQPTPSNPTTPNPSSTEEGGVSSCRGVRLSELWPNPAGVDDGEFIELENVTGKAVSLAGCKAWVNDKRVYTFSEGSVPARGFFVAEKSITKLSLTNDGGVVRLDDADGTELDRAEYPKAKDGLSWSRFADSWGWTEKPTSGSANTPPSEEAVITGASRSATAKEKVVLEGMLGELQELDSGELVHVTATVTAPVDALGTRVTYVQDETGAASLLLAEDAEKPAVGDLVEITGTVRSFQGRKRLSVKAEDLKILSHGQPITPKEFQLDELTPDVADQLVTVSGVIASTSGSKIMIDDGSAEGVVYLKSSTGILKPKMSSGDTLFVTGIVSVSTASGVRVLPRANEDLRVERVSGVTTTSEKPEALPTAPAHQTIWYWALVGVGLAAAGAKPAWEAWKKRQGE